MILIPNSDDLSIELTWIDYNSLKCPECRVILNSITDLIYHSCGDEEVSDEVLNERKDQVDRLELEKNKSQKNSRPDIELAVVGPQQVPTQSTLVTEEVAPMQKLSQSLWDEKMANSQDNYVQPSEMYNNDHFSILSYGKQLRNPTWHFVS